MEKQYYIVDGTMMDFEGLSNIAKDLGCLFTEPDRIITFLETQDFDVKKL